MPVSRGCRKLRKLRRATTNTNSWSSRVLSCKSNKIYFRSRIVSSALQRACTQAHTEMYAVRVENLKDDVDHVVRQPYARHSCYVRDRRVRSASASLA